MHITYFAAEAAAQAHTSAESAGGLAALGLNWQSFLFQLITFVIVLLILRQFVLKKLVATLESRRSAVEDSLKHASDTEERLRSAEHEIATMLSEARAQADDIVATGHKEVTQMIEAAEAKAAQRANHIVAEAKTQMQSDVAKAREQLKAETAQLVAAATEVIIKQKLDPAKDAALIKQALSKEQA